MESVEFMGSVGFVEFMESVGFMGSVGFVEFMESVGFMGSVEITAIAWAADLRFIRGSQIRDESRCLLGNRLQSVIGLLKRCLRNVLLI